MSCSQRACVLPALPAAPGAPLLCRHHTLMLSGEAAFATCGQRQVEETETRELKAKRRYQRERSARLRDAKNGASSKSEC